MCVEGISFTEVLAFVSFTISFALVCVFDIPLVSFRSLFADFNYIISVCIAYLKSEWSVLIPFHQLKAYTSVGFYWVTSPAIVLFVLVCFFSAISYLPLPLTF